MKFGIITGTVFMAITQASFADGTSLTNAAFGANLVHHAVVGNCIRQAASNAGFSATIRDIRVVDQASGKYEISLDLMNIDIKGPAVTLSVTSKTVSGWPWGQPVQTYECAVL